MSSSFEPQGPRHRFERDPSDARVEKLNEVSSGVSELLEAEIRSTASHYPEAVRNRLFEELPAAVSNILLPVAHYTNPHLAFPSTLPEGTSEIAQAVLKLLEFEYRDPSSCSPERIKEALQRVIIDRINEWQATFKDIACYQHELVSQACEEGQLDQLFAQEIELSSLLYLASNAALHGSGIHGIIHAVIRLDLWDALENHEEKGGCEYQAYGEIYYRNSLVPVSKLSDTMALLASCGLFMSRDPLLISAKQVLEADPSHAEFFSNKAIAAYPIFFGDTYLGAITIVLLLNDVWRLDGSKRKELLLVADATARGLAHLKRIKDRSPEVSI